jgi:hypothetical protein
MAREHRVALYLRGYLAQAGEKGWHETPESDPEHGTVELTNDAGEIVAYAHRFNSGDAKWFLSRCPPRLHGTPALPEPFRDGGR